MTSRSQASTTTSAEDSVTVHCRRDRCNNRLPAQARFQESSIRRARDEILQSLQKPSFELSCSGGGLPCGLHPKTGGAEVYEQCVLPIGARASVHSFLQNLLDHLGSDALLCLMWSVRLSLHCRASLTFVLMLLGWDTSPDKPSTFGGVVRS